VIIGGLIYGVAVLPWHHNGWALVYASRASYASLLALLQEAECEVTDEARALTPWERD